MTQPLFTDNGLDAAIDALRADLIAPEGPQISTMRNYRFAIVPYRPSEEAKLRRLVQGLSAELRGAGWGVLSISLQKLMLDRVRRWGDDSIKALVAKEKRMHDRDPARGLSVLAERITRELEGPDGIAADVIALIDDFARQHPDRTDRTLVLVGHAGSLYPFFRTSALLKHLDGRTGHLPVVLLYPGERRDQTGLSFMGELDADRDYRPRIYP